MKQEIPAEKLTGRFAAIRATRFVSMMERRGWECWWDHTTQTLRGTIRLGATGTMATFNVADIASTPLYRLVDLADAQTAHAQDEEERYRREQGGSAS